MTSIFILFGKTWEQLRNFKQMPHLMVEMAEEGSGFWVVLFGWLVWLFLVGCGCLLYLRGIKTLYQTQCRLGVF